MSTLGLTRAADTANATCGPDTRGAAVAAVAGLTELGIDVTAFAAGATTAAGAPDPAVAAIATGSGGRGASAAKQVAAAAQSRICGHLAG
nr:hypothetical protein [Mycobacterium gordonae]